MAVAPFSAYAPDISDLNGSTNAVLANVVPRADGYGPWPAVEELTQALPSACRGAFVAFTSDGGTKLFAGTSTRLYVLDNETLAWTDVSKSGSAYTELLTDAQWRFAQFNNFVFAVQQNTAPQAWDLTSSTAFADLGGSPPSAGGIAVINRFVVLFDLASSPYRIHWSGLNATTTWTSGTNYSDYQDLPDGGRVRGVAGGEYGLILQQRAIRRMVFVPGAAITFQIERIASDRGVLAPMSVCQGGDKVFFLSTNGFIEASGAGDLVPIGLERVDRTVIADVDTGNLQLCWGAVDPRRFLVLFVYKSTAGSTGLFDKGLLYNWALKRWAPVAISGECLAQLASPTLTLEGLDLIAPGYQAVTDTASGGSGRVRLTVASTSGWTTGDWKTIRLVGGTTEANGTWEIVVVDATHIDLVGTTYANAYTSGGLVAGDIVQLSVSLDEISSVSLPALGVFDSEHKFGLFSGDNLEATLETAEFLGTRHRVNVNGVQPHTDAPTCYASVGGRDVLNGSLTYGTESALDADGYCPVLENVRSGRVRLRIPSGTAWTFASGVEPEFMPARSRF